MEPKLVHPPAQRRRSRWGSAFADAVWRGPRPGGDAIERLRVEVVSRPRVMTAASLAVAFALTFILRALFIERSYDVLSDEVTYLEVSKNVVGGQGVTLHGAPFFLHPPLFFLIEGLVTLLSSAVRVIDQVQNIRYLNASLAGATAVALYAIARRIGGRPAAFVTIAWFALDPFMIRINSRNLLETCAFLWIALGYLVLLPLTDPTRGARTRGTARWRRWRRPVAAGVLLGLALLTKDVMAFLVFGPLGIAVLTGWCLRRRTALAVAMTAAATYAVYPLGVILAGDGPEFFAQKLHGLVRFLGLVKTTGFVASGGPSFLTAVTKNLDIFAPTYVLIGLGIPAALLLFLRGTSEHRLVALLSGSAFAMLAYSVFLGTLEEQFFYYLVMPALLAVVLAWRLVLGFENRPRIPSLTAAGSRLVGLVAPVALAVALAWSGLVWLEVHLTPDNGYEQMLTYMKRNVPNGTPIGVTTEPQQFILQGYVIVQVPSVHPLQNDLVSYAAVSSKQVEEGYVKNGESVYAWLRANAEPVFTFEGRTYGKLILFRMPTLPSANVLLPAPDPGPGDPGGS